MLLQIDLRLRFVSIFSSFNTLTYSHGLFSRSVFTSQSESFSASSSSKWLSILRTAATSADLSLGKTTHALIITSGQNPDRFFANNLITMYSKCGSLVYAHRLFDTMPDRDLVSWTSILTAFALSADSDVEKGFAIFRCLLREPLVSANRLTLAPVLKLCLLSGYVWASEAVHGYAVKVGLELDVFVSGSLVNIYCKFGHVTEARSLFERMCGRDVVLWNVMFKAYMEIGLDQEGLNLFAEFHRSGLCPDYVTMHCVLSGMDRVGCSSNGNKYLEQIQAYLTKLSFCGNNNNDQTVVVSWNKRMSEHVRVGETWLALSCFVDMIRSMVKFDKYTIVVALRAIVGTGDMNLGQQIHCVALKSGLERDVSAANSLINMYSKAGSVYSAEKVFKHMQELDLISWNSMISSCSQNGLEEESVRLFRGLLGFGLLPDQFSLASILRACSSLEEGLSLARQIHVHAVKSGKATDRFISTALIDVYSRRGKMEEAEIIFNKRTEFSLPTWNAMMSGYIVSENSREALRLLTRIHERGEKADGFSLATAAKASGSIVALEPGKQIHCYATKLGLDSDLYVTSGILDMYIKCGDMESANAAFSGILVPDDVAWTTMISGCVENADEVRSLSIYHRMRLSGVRPDEFTFATLVKASSSLAALEQGKQIHANAVKLDCASDPFVATSLVDMYAKCGDIEDSFSIFRRMRVRNTAAWNAMLVGLAQHGNAKEALELFKLMTKDQVGPDRVTFVGVLSACSHAGLVPEAYAHLSSMSRVYGIDPEIEHYSCLVDALGRTGRLAEAENVISSMPFRASASMYRALLSACRVRGDTETGARVAEKLLALEPSDSHAYVLLSNIYSAASLWDEASAARELMRRQGVKKDPGFSWVVVKNKVHLFTVDDKSHPESDLICDKVEDLMTRIRGEGYAPDTDFVLADLEREEKERALYYHSEKLAIAYGLLATPRSAVIRVIKNLRVCGDCHNAIKYISKVCQRDIVLRDSTRFHRFRDGICSCADYW